MELPVYAEVAAESPWISAPPDAVWDLRSELSGFRALVVVQTPEPATLALTAVGLLALGVAARRVRT